MLKLLVLLSVAALARADSCSPAVPASITKSLPPSVATQISEAFTEAADIVTIGSILSTAELTSVTLSYAEEVIESYAHSYYSLITLIETYFLSPSVIAPSSVSSITYVTYLHPTLASAVSEVVSFESSHTSFATAQQTLQSIEVSQSSILTYLSEYTEIASPSVSIASGVIAEATLTSPSILATVISLYTADVSYSNVVSALSSLSYEVYILPSTVVSEVLTFISSPCTAPPSVVSSIESCYPSLWSDLSYITEFTKSHSSVVTAITDLIEAESSISSLSTAAYTIISEQMPTLTYQISVLTQVSYSWPSFSTDIELISEYTATSPTLGCALSVIESSFYESPSIASAIYCALTSPSTVRNPQQISYEDISHQSLVTAITELLSWESAYSSYASTVSGILSKLLVSFETQRTLLTAASYVSTAASPSVASASVAINTLESIVTDITSVLSEVSYVADAVPSVSCDESVVASYAATNPTVVSELWMAAESPSLIAKSSVSYYASLEASYSSAFSALLSIASETQYYSSLASYEYSFIQAASIDPYALSQYSYFSSAQGSASSAYASYSY